MRFMMLMIPSRDAAAASGTVADAKAVAAIKKYNESLQRAGILLALDGLHPLSLGARVSFEDGKPHVVAGALAATREVLGGYWMIQVKSREEAIAWASRYPAAANEVIEIRQVQELGDFPTQIQQVTKRYPELQPPPRRPS